MKCAYYVSWKGQEPKLNTNECVEYYEGRCHEPLSAFSGEPCPWSGYPEGRLETAKAPETSPESKLAALLSRNR